MGEPACREAAQYAGGGRGSLACRGYVQQSCKHDCRPGASFYRPDQSMPTLLSSPQALWPPPTPRRRARVWMWR